jgi:hypothetical protein
LFKELLNGNNNIDIIDMALEENTSNFTNTNNQVDTNLSSDDLKQLNEIMNDIIDLSNNSSSDQVNIDCPKLNRIDSLNISDFNFDEFDAFESDIHMINDPMLSTNQVLNIF